MTSPKTTDQLADAIEQIVTAYLEDLRRTAQEAVERALSRSSTTTRPIARKSKQVHLQPSAARRRSATELDALCEKLHHIVCTRPGEPMVAFADELGVKLPELQRPMAKLRAEGRVRSVGERNMTRYFPTVTRSSKAAGG